MIRVNVHEAKTQLSKILEKLERGDENVVVICRRNEPVAELRAVAKRPCREALFQPVPGFTVPDRFFEPLPDDLLKAFEGAD